MHDKHALGSGKGSGNFTSFLHANSTGTAIITNTLSSIRKVVRATVPAREMRSARRSVMARPVSGDLPSKGVVSTAGMVAVEVAGLSSVEMLV